MAASQVRQDSLGGSLFGREPHNYVWLTSTQPFAWSRKPKHALSIPSDWSRHWDGDYGIEPDEFLPRAMALHICAENNAKALRDTNQEDGYPDEWTLVFRVGGWDKGYLHLYMGEADLIIDTRVTLVRPTAEEVSRFAGQSLALCRCEGGAA